jgi:hypothetical protein
MAVGVRPYRPVPRRRRRAVVDLEGFRDFAAGRVVPYLAGLYDGDVFRVYRGPGCVKEFLRRHLTYSWRNTRFYAHFGQLFDFPLILDELDAMPQFNLYPLCSGSRVIQLKVKDAFNHQWVFNDSGALLSFSLDSLTKAFNVEHRKQEIVAKGEDYDLRLHDLYIDDPRQVIEYLRHDCLGLWEVLLKFEDLIGKANVGLTTASTAMKTFRHDFLPREMVMAPRDVNDEMRQAYFGGRTEIFRLYAPPPPGDDFYGYYDVNSLYPFVMDQFRFPVSGPQTHRSPDRSILLEPGISRARVTAPNGLYVPVLPCKVRVGPAWKLMFPVGRFEGSWDHCLLREALELGYKVEPLKSFTFEEDFVFQGYVRHFYEMKRHSEKGTPPYLIAKLLMNSLYGKFGQHEDTETAIKDPDPDPEEYELLRWLDEDRGWVLVKSHGKGKFYLPQVAVHVTARAQLVLFDALRRIVERGGRIFYCDTDSVVTDDHRLPVSDKLGDFKLEHRVYESFFLLPKTYCLTLDGGRTELRAKGYPRQLQRQITKRHFEDALFRGDLKGFTLSMSQAELLRPRASFTRHGNFNSLGTLRRSIHTSYDKRRVLHDFDTRPHDIRDLVRHGREMNGE